MTKPQPEEVWLTIGVAAKRYGIDARTLRKILIEDDVQVRHLSGRSRFLLRETDLEALIERRTGPVTP